MMSSQSCPSKPSLMKDVISLPEFSISLESVYESALVILEKIKPAWCELKDEAGKSPVKIKSFDEGVTNKVFGFYMASAGGEEEIPVSQREMVLFRVFGEKTEQVVDRGKELLTLKMLFEVGLGPELYCVFGNGLAYEFMRGVPLDEKNCRDPHIQKLVATTFAQWHCNIQWCKSEFDYTTPMAVLKARQWLETLSDHEGLPLPDVSDQVVTIDQLKLESAELEQKTRLDEELVFSHNDTLLGNLVYDEKEQVVRLIDYEYGGPSYRAYDIGNHFDEMCGIGDTLDYGLFPDCEEQKRFITYYLDTFHSIKSLPPPTDQQVDEFYRNTDKMCLLAHFSWGIWSLLQSTISKIDFDYTLYAQQRLTEYYRRKTQFMNL